MIETAEVFRIKTPEIHNEVALAAFESCKEVIIIGPPQIFFADLISGTSE